jgi:hypothetical protein
MNELGILRKEIKSNLGGIYCKANAKWEMGRRKDGGKKETVETKLCEKMFKLFHRK